MATVITEDCINCGACEPECPNVAIFQGGVEYEWGGATQAALSDDFFFIVPEKCTECVGFFDQEACAVVCPVDCCLPDPARPEDEAALLVRAKQLHPGTEFGDDFPSRFKEGGGGSAPAAAPAAGAPAAAAAPAPAPAAAAAAPAGAAPAGAGPARLERATHPPRMPEGGDPTRQFDGELTASFDGLLNLIEKPSTKGVSRLVGLGLLAASPGLGALGHSAKVSIERAFGDRRYFSAELSTALNMVQNFVLYPVAFLAFSVAGGMELFTESDRGPLIVGIIVALLESAWRLREGFFGVPVAEMKLGPALYGAPLSLVLAPFLARLVPGRNSGHVPVEGFYSNEFDSKRERQRRYGEVYRVDDFDGGYLVSFELPSVVPASGAKENLGIGDEMPDYDVNVSLADGGLVVTGSVVDKELRALCGVSSAFPADFKTTIALEGSLTGFRHRYANRLLEVLVLKAGG